MSLDIDCRPAQKAVADQLMHNLNMQAAQARTSNQITAVRLDNFDVIEPHFLEPWLLYGMGTTLYSGDNGIGKSATALWTAARVTLGGCAGELHTPSNVLLLLSEDAPGIIRPKLEALYADMSRVYVAVCTEPGESAVEGITYLQLPKQGQELETLIAGHHIKLMILDALADCFEHPDINKTENVAPVLTFLNHLSAKYKLAIVGIHHTNKNLLDGAKNAVRGSKAFTDKARQVVSFIKTEDAYGFQVTKSNFMEGTPAWHYTLESAPTLTPGKTTGIISTPIPDDDLDVDREMRKSANLEDDRQSSASEVIDWLTDYLREGAAPFKQIMDAAREEGYTAKQLGHAREKATNPFIESVRDPAWTGRGQRKIWKLSSSSNTPQPLPDNKVGSNRGQIGNPSGRREMNTPRLLPIENTGSNENKSFSLHLERLAPDQADGIIETWQKMLTQQGHDALDSKLTRMSGETLEMPSQHGGILKALADREFQRRSDSFTTTS
ncbi:MAG: AAA family ATPase [Bifidobacterium tibiigranuli]|uniref:AAA family ATPase n=2 Tax=Bifidobacterium tibiigranuli TaxID=2172043 RepID=UPI0023546CA6|nr:AAA family ATPase [Bifidobacterium tibiigranuli]MCH4189413.1 AAA family ATPase [Bifidobacterium tibiigranuli]MCH4203802.1 AAA family ATPase [Bifidobacterium tibiigranuli]MCH4274356.1 AAA family ATPase [Bifidobacterium tibiigranuli]